MLFTKRLSIQSKLILLLLVVSLGSMLLIAVIGYRSGREALRASVTSHLTSLREAKADLIRARLKLIDDQVCALCEDRMIVEAMKDFKAAFDKLPPLKSGEEEKLKEFYKEEFLPDLKKN